MKWIRFVSGVGLGIALLGQTLPAQGQTKYDAPVLTQTGSGFFRITLQIQAGPSGAPAGFEIQWMTKADYDRLGGWPTDEYDPALALCEFTGVPTLNVDSASPSFQLSPDGTIHVQIGDLFDETGVVATYADQLPSGSDFVFRAYAIGSPGVDESDASATLDGSTNAAPECTQGFWKNHPDTWPAGCLPMQLGTVVYTQTQLLAILNQPANGNGLVSLAHQLIATKLNICNGSDPTPVAGTIADADALIDGLVIPPVGGGFLAPSSTSALTETLDDYNNGLLGGVTNCPTPTRAVTWGGVKALYR